MCPAFCLFCAARFVNCGLSTNRSINHLAIYSRIGSQRGSLLVWAANGTGIVASAMWNRTTASVARLLGAVSAVLQGVSCAQLVKLRQDLLFGLRGVQVIQHAVDLRV